jgi:ATP-dependent Lhr-like helicase
LLAETFPHEGRHYLVVYPFEGWNAHQSLGMLVTKRMEMRGLKPMGFVASDYALGIWSLEEVTDLASLYSRPTYWKRSSSTGSRTATS